MEMVPVASRKVLAAYVPVIGVHSMGTGRMSWATCTGFLGNT